jgi:predicted ATP-grasp superfamily ATP-dependent carboligase
MSSPIRILITDGHSRQVLPMAKAFKKLGCKVTTINFSKMDIGYTSRYPDEKIIDKGDKENYETRLKFIDNLIKSKKYDIVVPTTDFSAILLSKNKEEFSKYSYVAVCNWDIMQIAADKLNTMKVCMENSIPCTRTLLKVSNIQDILSAKLTFPLVIKPRISYGAIGFRVVKSQDELITALHETDQKLEELIIQEYIPQSDLQYETAIFADENSDIKTSLIFSKNRWFPVKGGSSTLNITIDDEEIRSNCIKLMKLIKWQGCADIDLIRDPRDGVAKIMEINPRVSGSVKICFVAGVDQARQILESAKGIPVTEYHTYRKGVRLRAMHTDLLWFISSRNRFNTQPSWFSIKNTSEQIFSLDDPIPWFSYTFQSFVKYRKEMKKRK